MDSQVRVCNKGEAAWGEEDEHGGVQGTALRTVNNYAWLHGAKTLTEEKRETGQLNLQTLENVP